MNSTVIGLNFECHMLSCIPFIAKLFKCYGVYFKNENTYLILLLVAHMLIISAHCSPLIAYILASLSPLAGGRGGPLWINK